MASLLRSTVRRLATSARRAATAEATQEAVYNALLKATPVTGRGRTVEALPIQKTVEILTKYNALNWDRLLPPGRSQ